MRTVSLLGPARASVRASERARAPRPRAPSCMEPRSTLAPAPQLRSVFVRGSNSTCTHTLSHAPRCAHAPRSATLPARSSAAQHASTPRFFFTHLRAPAQTARLSLSSCCLLVFRCPGHVRPRPSCLPVRC
eukprot:2582863-Pleurochrysis_carterae.AAC.1